MIFFSSSTGKDLSVLGLDQENTDEHAPSFSLLVRLSKDLKSSSLKYVEQTLVLDVILKSLFGFLLILEVQIYFFEMKLKNKISHLQTETSWNHFPPTN